MNPYVRTRLTRFFATAASLSAAAVFLTTVVQALWYLPDSEVPVPEFNQALELVSSGQYPERLVIPALGIDAYVQELGINAKGNMAAPNNFTDVGWYKYGSPPGFVGSAVIAGHVDNGLGLAGVFKNLSEIKIGDDIYIDRRDSTSLHFRVSEIQVYPYTHVPRETLFLRRDLPRLNLITCEGAWVADERTYDQRLVVYAELVSG